MSTATTDLPTATLAQSDAPPMTVDSPWSPPTEAATDAASPWDAATQDAGATAEATAAPEAPADPWATSVESEAASGGDAWATSLEDNAGSADGWGAASNAGADVAEPGFQLQQLWDGSLRLDSWINDGLTWVIDNFRPFFQSVRAPIDSTLVWIEGLLTGAPMLAMVVVLGLLAWQFAGRGIAIGAVVSLLLIGMLGIWSEAMVTLSLVLTSLVFCVAIGLPLGIAVASSDRAQRWSRPLLDAMQTTPAFVYLVPVVMLFGIGNVPGVIVTIVFALPPLVRLTNLGLRQVRPDLVEAARAYGASPWQMLTKVKLPLAMPSIMAGINQALMLSLSMVVIASMIAVGGLGQMVLRGIGRLDMGMATIGGLGIVLLAVTLDRLTQAMGAPRRGARHWWQTGPVGLLLRPLLRSNGGRANESAVPPRAAQDATNSGMDPVLQGAGR